MIKTNNCASELANKLWRTELLVSKEGAQKIELFVLLTSIEELKLEIA